MRMIARRKVADTAKILIVISITLLIYGTVLTFTSNNHLSDPLKDTDLINDEESVISITPSSGSEVITSNSNNSNDNSSTNVNNNGNNNGNNIRNTTNRNNGSNDSNNRFSTNDSENTIDKKNDLIRKKIEGEFSISIKYGKETEGYTVGGVSTFPITDSGVIEKELEDLYNTLSLYPTGIFREIRDGGIPLTIILVNNYSENGITGITDSSYEYANISIAAIYDFAESFYHESYHYMERYMFKRKANFNSWDSLNPEGFVYNTIDGSNSYSKTFSEDAYFVNNYAQTAAAEDRASTFEYMMAPTKASCLNNEKPVWKKARYMALTIEAVFNTVSPDSIEYWERFL